ncbi:MAG: glycosyltransferase family 1 protein [Candidatus Dormibacteria bacterium]
MKHHATSIRKGPSSSSDHELPLRVALVTETWHPHVDGIVTRLSHTVHELKRQGHEVLVIAPSGERTFEGAPVVTVPALGIPFIYAGKKWGLPTRRVDTALSRFAPDVVHAVGPFVLGMAAVRWAHGNRTALVCSYHTRIARYARHYHVGFAQELAWWQIRRLHRAADINLAASDWAALELAFHGVPGAGVWRGGVDFDLFHPMRGSLAMRERITRAHPERAVLLYVGRLAPEKGLDRLLPLVRGRKDRHLVMVGDGPARPSLEQAFAGTNTTFMGMLTPRAVAESCASSDVFVFPSTTDTLGLVVLEARAAGLPTVVPGTENGLELLAGSRYGDVFRPDTVGDLDRAVQGVLDTRASRLAVSEEARRRYLGWRECTDGLVDHYHQALALKGATSLRRKVGSPR